MKRLLLLFKIGSTDYSINTENIEGVIPSLPLSTEKISALSKKELIEGYLTYKNDTVPVIDLCKLILSQKASSSITTRIALLRTSMEIKKIGINYIGLRAEQMTGCHEIEPHHLTPHPAMQHYPFFKQERFLIDKKEYYCLNIQDWIDNYLLAL